MACLLKAFGAINSLSDGGETRLLTKRIEGPARQTPRAEVYSEFFQCLLMGDVGSL